MSDLKSRARYCNCGDSEESMIVDMLINKCRDEKCTEKLMELRDEQLTLNTAIRICRQMELTQSHLKTLSEKTREEQIHRAEVARRGQPGRGRGPGRRKRRGRGHGRGAYQGWMPFCDRCCKHHHFTNCPAFHKYCDTCGEKGHFNRSARCSQKMSGQG